MSDDLNDCAVQKAAISGRFARDYEFTLQWLPEYIEEFPEAMRGISLDWKSCKFMRTAKIQIPDKFGVYCFSINLGEPFAKEFNVPLYIGKAAPQHLSGRFEDYLTERGSIKGRKKVVVMLNKYRNKLRFWWAELPRIHVDAVEEHLLMCCKPPCNEIIPNKQKLWNKAFE